MKTRMCLFARLSLAIIEKSGGTLVVLAAITCPKSIKGTNSPASPPSNMVMTPKTTRPVERSLKGMGGGSGAAISGDGWFTGRESVEFDIIGGQLYDAYDSGKDEVLNGFDYG